MKHILSLLAAGAILLFAGKPASAQIEGPGLIGGFTSSVASANNFDARAVSTYHVGITRKFNLGLGFAFQPSVLYQMKGTSLDLAMDQGIGKSIRALDTSVGYVEIPCQFQWGPDLMAFRPYVLAEPYVGFGVTMNAESPLTSQSLANDWKGAGMTRWEYGFGVGGGIEIWRLQISGRYFWNLGSLCDDKGNINPSSIASTVNSAFANRRSFNGFNLSLVLFFGSYR